MKTKNIILKKFVVRKYIFAKSAQDALRLDKKIKPDECWVDDDWKKNNESFYSTFSTMGFSDRDNYNIESKKKK